MKPGPKFVSATVEPNEENTDGLCVTVYFNKKPTAAEVKYEFERLAGKLTLSVDTEDQFYSYGEYPNALSKRSKLVRIQGFPTG